MIYVSIDIETSGLDSDKNKVLSIGAIIEDTTKKLSFEEIPKFNAVILQREIIGSPRALTINKDIIECIGHYLESDYDFRIDISNSTGYNFYEEDNVIKEFYLFLSSNGLGLDSITSIKDIDSKTKPITINVAGKNFGTFDKLFLEKLPWWKKIIYTRQRVLDPAILCVDWNNDKALPNLTNCKERLDIKGIVTHNALEDAWDVIEILRKFY